MDTELLVEDHIEAGKSFIDGLNATEFDITAAFWIKTVEENRWYFYIASKHVDVHGQLASYREITRIFKRDDDWDLMSRVKLIGTTNPITQDILKLKARYPARIPPSAQRTIIGHIATEEIYVYSDGQDEKEILRQSFRVTYCRLGESNTWTGETKPEGLYRGLKAKGAVAYSTAGRSGEPSGDEKFANVSVLMELDSQFGRENPLSDPNVTQLLASQARDLADRMFKEKHPEALIEHGLDQN